MGVIWMLKDFLRRILFRYNIRFFAYSTVHLLFQISLRALLFHTDDYASRTRPDPDPGPNAPLYSINSHGVFEVCNSTSPKVECLTVPGNFSPGNATAICGAIADYAVNKFRNDRIEDISFVGIEIYLLFVAVYTIARESIPHIITIFVARFLSMVWSIARVGVTAQLRSHLVSLFNGQHCVNPLKPFWEARITFEIMMMVTNIISLAIGYFVCRNVGFIYARRPWKVVEVPRKIKRMYKVLMGFSVVIQLLAFILPLAMALWIDQLVNGSIMTVSSHTGLYKAIFIASIIVFPLWSIAGWYSMRLEWQRISVFFILFGIIFLASWSILFDSLVYRWVFVTYRFSGTMTTMSLILIGCAVVLGCCCRSNFDQNLREYLLLQTSLVNSHFTHDHFEEDPDPLGPEPKTLKPLKLLSSKA